MSNSPRSCFIDAVLSTLRQGSGVGIFALVAFILLLPYHSAQAQATYTYNVNGSAAWNAGASWLPATGFPMNAGDVADVNNAITANSTLSLNAGITIGILNIGAQDSTHTFTIAAGTSGTLTFNNNGAGAQISESATTGGDSISAGVVIADAGGLTVSNASATKAFGMSGNITGSGNLVLDANAAGAITVSAAAVNNAGTITNSGAGSGSVTISSAIGANVTGITQNSAGSLTLSGNNSSYDGTTTLTSGTLSLNTATALGGNGSSSGTGGAFVISGGVISLWTTQNTVNAENWNGSFSYSGGGSANTGTSAITLGANVTVGNTGGNIFTVGGSVGGTGNLTIAPLGNSIIVFSGSMGYTGNLILDANSGNGNAIGLQGIVNNIGTITNSGTNTGGASVSGTVGQNVTGVIESSTSSGLSVAVLQVNNSAGTTLTNSNTAGSKAITVSGSVGGTGNLVLNNNSTITNGINITGAVNNAGTITNSGNGTGSVTISGNLGSNVTSVTENSTTSLTLSGSNANYDGSTTLTSGTLFLSSTNALGGNGSPTGTGGTLTISGGTLNTSGVTLSTVNAQNWNGSFTFGSTANLTFGTGAITLSGSVGITNIGGHVLTEGGNVGGTGNLTLNSASGAQIFTFTGTVNNNGTIAYIGTSGDGLASTLAAVGSNVTMVTLSATNMGLTIANLTVNSAGTTLVGANSSATTTQNLTISGPVGGTGNLILDNNGSVASGVNITGMVNNTGTITNSGTGTGTVSISSVGSNVTAITESGSTSTLTISGTLLANSVSTTLANNNAGGTGTLTISGSIGGTGNLVINNNSAIANGISFSGAVNNTGAITNSGGGSGSVTLAGLGANVTNVMQNSATSTLNLGSNTNYDGVITLTSGTLSLNSATSLGGNGSTSGTGGAFVISGGVISAWTTPGTVNAEDWNGSFTYSGGTTNTGTDTITLGGNVTVTNSGGGVVTVGGNVGGTGNLTLFVPINSRFIFTGTINNNGAFIDSGSSAGGQNETIAAVGSNVTAITESGNHLTLGITNLTVNSGSTTITNNSATNNSTISITNAGGAGNLVLNNNTTSNNDITFSGAVNNAGTVTNSGTGTGSVAISAVGSNVTGIIESSTSSVLNLSGSLAVNSGGTTFTNNNTGGSAQLTESGSIVGTGNLVLDNNSGVAGGVSISGSVNNVGTLTSAGSGTGSTVISGNIGTNVTSVTVGGTSALFLSGASIYTGNTTVLSGATLGIGSNSTVTSGTLKSGPLGTGTLVLNSGASLDASTNVTIVNNVVLGANLTFLDNGGYINFNNGGVTSPSAATTYTAAPGSNWTVAKNGASFSQNVNFTPSSPGGVALTVSGSGVLLLSGTTNDFGGGSVTVNGDLTFGGGGFGTTNSNVSSTNVTNFLVNSGGILNASPGGANAQFGTATITLNGGTLEPDANSTAAWTNAILVTAPNSTFLGLSSGNLFATFGSLTLSATNFLASNAGGSSRLTIAGTTLLEDNVTINASYSTGVLNYLEFLGGVSDDSATSHLARSLTITGTGGTAAPVVVGGTSTYTGATFVFNGGELYVAANNALPDTVLTIDSTSSLHLDNTPLSSGNTTYSQRILGLGGSGSVTVNDSGLNSAQTSTLTFDDTNTADFYTFSGSISDNLSNTDLIAILKSGASTQILNGTNTYHGSTTIAGGVLQANDGVGLSGSSVLIFGTGTNTGGVLQSNGLFTRTLGSGTTGGVANVMWTGTSNGGFAAKGGTLTVVLGGTAAPANLTWGTTTGFIASGQTLLFGSTTSDSLVNFENAVALAAGVTNTVQVNLGTGTDLAQMSGVISGAAGSTLVKTGAGTLLLSATNTYAGSTSINGGTLQIGNTRALGTGSSVGFGGAGGTLEYAGAVSGTLSQGINLSSAGQIQTDGVGTSLTLTGGINTNSSVVTFSGSGNTVISGGVVSGNGGSLVKNGSGTLTMDVINTYGGTTTINNGVVSVNNLGSGNAADSLGSQSNANMSQGDLVINGGTLQYTGGGGTTDRAMTIGASGGTLDASGSGAITFAPGKFLLFTGTGATTLTLTGTNTGVNTIATDIFDQNGGTVAVTKSGVGTWALSDADDYSGITTINAGTLQVGFLNAVGAEQSLGYNANVNLGSGTATGTLQYTGGDAQLYQNITVGTGGGVLSNTGGGVLTVSGILTKANAVLTFTGGVFDVTGQITGGGTNTFNSDLDVNNATVTVSATNNNYTGPTVVSNSGTLVDGVDNALPAGTVLTLGSGTDGAVTNTYNLNGFNQSVAALDSVSSGSNINIVTNTGVSTLTLTGTNSDNAIVNGNFHGRIQDGSGKTSVAVSGGTQTLSGSNNYTGNTTISSGTLALVNTTSNNNIANSAQIIVGTGTGTNAGLNVTGISGGFVVPVAQTISGFGTVTGATTVNGSLTPGTGAGGGTLTFASGLTIGNGAQLNYGLGTNGDLVAVTGGLTLSGSAILNFSPSGTLTTGVAYDLITYTGSLTGGANLGTWALGTGIVPVGTTGETFGTISLGGGTSAITITFNSGAATTPAVAYWQGVLGASGTGAWNTVTSGSTNFTTDAAGTTNTQVIPGAVTNVKFTANSGSNVNTTLGQDFTINSLEFTGSASSPVTIGGTNTLTINATGTNGNTPGNGITVDAGSAAHLISSKVALGSSQTWTVNGSTLTVSGNISDGGNHFGLTKSGTGTLDISGSASYSGTTTVNAGALKVDGSLSGSSAVTVNAAILEGIGTVNGPVSLTGSGTLRSLGTLTLAQGFSVSGSANTLSTGTVSGNATQNAASAFTVNGILSGSDTLAAGASLSGTGSVGATTLNGTDDISSAATLTVASLAVNGSGNTISSGTVNATAGTSLSNGSSLAVNGTLGGGAVTTGSGSTLSGTGTITSTLTVSAGGVTSPGVGNKTGVMTTDLSYNGGSMANFNVATTGSAGTPTALNSGLFYSQMIVTGGSNTVNLGIGTGVSLQSQTAGQIQTSGSIGSSNSGVTLQLTLSSTDYASLVSNASSDYNAKSSNSTLDNYFVFNLGTGLTAGRFETLALDVDGVTTTGLIYYAGTNDRFAADGVDNTIGDVYVTVNGVNQEFALSYTGNFADGANATIGGNDIVLTAIPEPGTWGMVLGGFGMLIGFQRLRKRRMGI